MSWREIRRGEAVSENDRIWLLLSLALRCEVVALSSTTCHHYMRQKLSPPVELCMVGVRRRYHDESSNTCMWKSTERTAVTHKLHQDEEHLRHFSVWCWGHLSGRCLQHEMAWISMQSIACLSMAAPLNRAKNNRWSCYIVGISIKVTNCGR